MDNSQHAIIRKTEVVPVGHNDQMIEHFDIKERSSPTDFLGQLFIRLARFEVPRGVVMGKDNGHAQGLEHHGKEDAQVHHGTRDSPIRYLIGAFDPIGIVEQKDFKGFLKGQGIVIPIGVQQ